MVDQPIGNMAGYSFLRVDSTRVFWRAFRPGEPKYNSTRQNTQPYLLFNHLKKCLLYDCFLLTLVKSIFFIHTKVARFCLISWNSWQCFNAGRKLVRSFVTVIGCWARASLHFPAFFGRTRTYVQTYLRLSVLKKLDCVNSVCCKLLLSALYRAINWRKRRRRRRWW